MFRRLSAILACLLLLSINMALANSDQEAKIVEVRATLSAIQQIPDKRLPSGLLEKATGIAIIPSVVKVGFVVGGQYGKGVISIRQPDGQWSNPVFVSMSGGSVGWQIGVQAADIILVFMTDKSVEGILDGKFTLGADASIAAGPVGRDARAATDAKFKAEIYSWSRSRGLFAGVALDGARLRIENDDNAHYYRQLNLQAQQIFSDEQKYHPASADEFKNYLHNATGNEHSP